MHTCTRLPHTRLLNMQVLSYCKGSCGWGGGLTQSRKTTRKNGLSESVSKTSPAVSVLERDTHAVMQARATAAFTFQVET